MSYWISLLRKAKVKCYGNVDTKTLCDNKRDTVKPLFPGKIARKDKIILLEKDEKTEAEEIVEDDQMVAENLNDFFSNVISDLSLSRYIDPLINTEDVWDPVLKVKIKFANHPNIKIIINR